MIKKGMIAAGSLATAFLMSAGLVLAQTPTPSPSPSPTVSPSPAVPRGAPATGFGG